MSTGLKRRFSDIDEDVAEVDSSALLLKTSSSAFISSAVPRKKKLEFPTVPHALISGSGASAKLVLSRDYIATKVRAWPRVRSTIQTLDGKMSLLRWEAPLESRRFDASGAPINHGTDPTIPLSNSNICVQNENLSSTALILDSSIDNSSPESFAMPSIKPADVPPKIKKKPASSRAPSSLGADIQSSSSAAKQLMCPFPGCGQLCLDASKLKRHSLKHSGERPFVCEHPEWYDL
jgi:hypothetical protein